MGLTTIVKLGMIWWSVVWVSCYHTVRIIECASSS